MFEAFGTIDPLSWTATLASPAAHLLALEISFAPLVLAMGLVILGMTLSVGSLASFANYLPGDLEEDDCSFDNLLSTTFLPGPQELAMHPRKGDYGQPRSSSASSSSSWCQDHGSPV